MVRLAILRYQTQSIATQLDSLASTIKGEVSQCIQQMLLEIQESQRQTRLTSPSDSSATTLCITSNDIEPPLTQVAGSETQNPSQTPSGRVREIDDLSTDHIRDTLVTPSSASGISLLSGSACRKKDCQCFRYVHMWQVRYGYLRLLRYFFGSLLLEYISVLALGLMRNPPRCRRLTAIPRVTIRYTLPVWAAQKIIISSISYRGLGFPLFALRMSRRVPYTPGNIFSRINSKDFAGAINLLQNGNARIGDIETRHGTSILGSALRHPVLRPDFIQFIEFLLQIQVDPYVPNDYGESPWLLAARFMLPNTPPSLASSELKACFERLFPGPDWGDLQFTRLHMVISGLEPLSLKDVLQSPTHLAQINTEDALGQTPLALAAMLGDDEAVEALLLAGADPNSYTGMAGNALRRAIQSASLRCVELLLMAGASTSALDSRGATFVHTAAAGHDTLPLLRPLLLAGIPIDSPNSHRCTPLSFTPLNDNHDVARLLLDRSANIDNVDRDGDTPLTESVRLNAHECLRLFLQSKADTQVVNKRGWTVLHFAAAYGDAATLDLLAGGEAQNARYPVY